MIQKKKCYKCWEVKELESGFCKHIAYKDGYCNFCLLCMNKYSKQYRKDNSELVRAKARQKYRENIEKETKRKRQYWIDNAVELRKLRMQYWRKNKEQYKKNSDTNCRLLLKPYIRVTIRETLGLKSKDVTPEMIQVKREQLLLHRQLKTLKQEVQHGIA